MTNSQIFVIASVSGRYQSLAAVTCDDEDNPYDATRRLRRCHQAFRTFTSPDNRNAIMRELDLAAEFSSDKSPENSEALNVAVDYESTASESSITSGSEENPCPFPFISTCLAVASSYDFDGAGIVPCDLLPVETAYDEEQNEEGIAVLDISNLNDIRYCFVWAHSWRGEEAPEETDTPLSAWQYLHSRSRIMEDDAPVECALADTLNNVTLIQPEALAGKLQLQSYRRWKPLQIWPEGQWPTKGPSVSTPPSYQPLSRGPRSLQYQSANVLIRTLLSSSDFDPSLLNEVRRMPNSREILQTFLLERQDEVNGSLPSIKLLEVAYGGQAYVDWSAYQNLPTGKIHLLMKGPAFEKTSAVSLHIKTLMTPQKLVELLNRATQIKRLIIFTQQYGQLQYADQEILAECSKLCYYLAGGGLYLSRPFASGLRGQLWLKHQSCHPMSNTFSVAQLLVAHQGKYRCSPARYEYFFLGDALLTPVKTVTGFFKYIRGLCHDIFGHNGGSGLAAAYGFSCSPSSLGESGEPSISPLPAETYLIAKRQWLYEHNRLYSKMRDLSPAAWTILLKKKNVIEDLDASRDHDSYHVHLKYAFVRSKIPIKAAPPTCSRHHFKREEIEVADLERFLSLMAPYFSTSRLAQAMRQLHEDLVRVFEPIYGHQDGASLATLDLDEACDLLHQFSSGVPVTEQAAKKAISGKDGGKASAWLRDLGFEAGPS
ncbi:hypothetical protein N7448_011028 [Penicillium atrosanguineum]|nr:hypothetical protein N7448_011028 [Penicillium atrosanguineum]